ncbi:MAG TPA: hypothetical protein VIQ03_00660 [Gammaproteobacteria bacterium]
MTDSILLEPTITSHWKEVIQHAESRCQCTLDEDLESYLIFTLIRFTNNPELANKALAPEFLQSLHMMRHARQQALRDVGDQCLLVAGLFPQTANKRLVRVSYYVDLGRNAYQQLSEILKQAFSSLYMHLSKSFVQLMDVLQNIREQNELQPLQALELWSSTGSQNAYRIIGQHTKATPVVPNKRIQH